MIRGCNKHVKSLPSEMFSSTPILHIVIKNIFISRPSYKTNCPSRVSVAIRPGLGSGCKAYSLIAGIIDAVETLQEGVSVNEVKALAGVCTNLVDNC
jgi:hypothetical protein